MKQVKAVFSIFAIFLLLSLLILFFFQTPVLTGLQLVTLPIQRWVFQTGVKSDDIPPSQQQLQQENNQLRADLANMQEIQKDNQALHDQFQTTTPAPQNLLPVDVIGIQENVLLIDKGDDDNVKVNEVVVVKNNLIGKVTKTTPHVSQVTLLSDPATSFTAQTAKTSATGIVVSQDGSIILGNVVLTEKLEKNDIVMTKGNRDVHGNGYPPNLIVGKIVSISKQPSSLFQAAKIQSLVTVGQLRMVFVETQ